MRKITILSFLTVSMLHNHGLGQNLISKDLWAEKILVYQLSNGAWSKQLIQKEFPKWKNYTKFNNK